MANYYTIVTPNQALPCTAEEANAIRLALLDGYDCHGFTFNYFPPLRDEPFAGVGEGVLCAEEMADLSELPDDALAMIGDLITRVGLPWLQFGVAHTCSKVRVGSHGGTSFRILASGTIEEPALIWPSGELPPLMAAE